MAYQTTQQVGRTGMQVGSPAPAIAGTAERRKDFGRQSALQNTQLQAQAKMQLAQQAFQRDRQAELIREADKDRKFQEMTQQINQDFQRQMQERVYKRADEVFSRDKTLIEQENQQRRIDDENRRMWEDSQSQMGLMLMLQMQRKAQADPLKAEQLRQKREQIEQNFLTQRQTAEKTINMAEQVVLNSPIGKGEFGLDYPDQSTGPDMTQMNWDPTSKGPKLTPAGNQVTGNPKQSLSYEEISYNFLMTQADSMTRRMTNNRYGMNDLLGLSPEKIQEKLTDGSLTTADLIAAKATSDKLQKTLTVTSPSYEKQEMTDAAQAAATRVLGRLRKFDDTIDLVRMDTKNPNTSKLLQDVMDVYNNTGPGRLLKDLKDTFGDGPTGLEGSIGAVRESLTKYMQEHRPQFVGKDAPYMEHSWNQNIELMGQALGMMMGQSPETPMEAPNPNNLYQMEAPNPNNLYQNVSDSPNPMMAPAQSQNGLGDIGQRVKTVLGAQRAFQGQQGDEQRRQVEVERIRQAMKTRKRG